MSDETAAIRRALEEYADAVNAGDVGKYGATLSADVVFHAPDLPPLHGRTSVQDWFKQAWLDTTNSRHLNFAVADVNTLGAWAYAHGRFTVPVTWKTGRSQDISGNFLSVLKRDSDARWQLALTNFNFDKPFVPAP